MIITTDRFKPTPGHYAGVLLRRWLLNNLWWLLLPLNAFLILGALVNGSFFYVAVIYILCVASLSQAIIFFNYALRPDTVIKTFEQEWQMTPEILTVTYLPTLTVNGDYVDPLVNSTQVKKESIKKLNITGRNLIFTLTGDYDILILPLSALSGDTDLNTVFKFYETDY